MSDIELPPLPPNYRWEESQIQDACILLYFENEKEIEQYATVDKARMEIRIWGKGKGLKSAQPIASVDEGLKIVAARAWLGEWT